MTMTVEQALAGFAGRTITGVALRDNEWLFQFEGGATLNVECPWRLITGGRIVFADTDHGQRFGRAATLDGVAEVKTGIAGRPILSCTLSETADLAITFQGGMRLEIWCQSAGYESWALGLPGSHEFIAVGGGSIKSFND